MAWIIEDNMKKYKVRCPNCDSIIGFTAKLKLKIFRQIYKVNPLRWSYTEVRWVDDIKHLYYGNHKIKLTFMAFCYFQLNRIFSRINEERKGRRDTLIWILEDCQKDIEYLKKQADREIERALKEQKKIFNNWN